MFGQTVINSKKLGEKERINWLRLIRSENIGPRNFSMLVELCGSVEKALEQAKDIAARGGKKKPLRIASEAEAVKEIEQTQKFGARIITQCEAEYPIRLREIFDAPPVITVFGNVEVLKKNTIAIVGSRNASANGCRFAYDIAKDIGRRGYIIASGLARGMDTAAHRGSLETGTIAVVAGGIDRIYPPENRDLFYKIGENGAVVTEMPFGAVPKSQNFPRRNRIISGLSLGVIVVEASLRSGSLITARMALEQGREVYAVPGSPMDPRCKGTNQLIKNGACLIESADDILEVTDRLVEERAEFLFERDKDFNNVSLKSAPDDVLENARPLVMEKLSMSPSPVDEVIRQTGFAANIVLTILLELELAGKLERQHGNKVALIYSEAIKEDLYIDAI